MSIDDLERTYAAILLVQFRNESYNTKRRVCEERLIKFKSHSSEEALLYSNKRGKEEEYDSIQDNQHVWFEFIGIIDIFEVTTFDDTDEVCSRFVERILPMERKNKIIPQKNKLSLFRPDKYKMKIYR